VRHSGAPSRHRSTERPAPTGPSLRTTILGTAAAVGAVASGTFTALLPSPGDASVFAAADETFDASLVSASATLDAVEGAPQVIGALSTISYDVTTIGGSELADLHLAELDKGRNLADQLAARQAEEARIAQERAELDALIATGGLDGWIAEALDIMELPQSLADSVHDIIMAESGGNPRAINNWDSNARRGTPSQGLMQTIPSTFHHYVHPDLADRPITDPVANITAGVRYMIDTYGIDTLEDGGRSDSSGNYIGY
jgi:soluble lytic murein transglycosylase-like protein